MTVSIRGKVPSAWNDQTAAHLTERLRALETALAGGRPANTAPAAPAFGPGAGVVVVSTPGGGGPSSGVTDHGELTGLSDNDHPQYLPRFESVTPQHTHNSEDIRGVAGRFQERLERRPPAVHTHIPEEIVGLAQRERRGIEPHAHRMGDVADLRGDDVQFILAGQVFGD